MRRITILCAALACAASVAQAWAAPEAGGTRKNDPNQRICRQITTLGSRLASQRMCMTRADWEASQRAARGTAEEGQTRQFTPYDLTPGARADANGAYLPAQRGNVPR